ncbi:MAG TPA: DUF433 domain-containing protein [Gemmataceae bacterium]|nr:DUF433 domain-containing protein [Gemmataceae bacterium]
MKPYAIIDRGRGPEIAGSRITVYDVLAETGAGATPEELAGWYQLDVEQIHLALRYIEEHKEEVERDWAAIKARHARGNSPEVQAKVEALRPLAKAKIEELRRRAREKENGDTRTAVGHQHPGTGGDPPAHP